MQGTIFSKTAVENYKELGPSLFKMSIPYCPAKRLGLPEEVRTCSDTPDRWVHKMLVEFWRFAALQPAYRDVFSLFPVCVKISSAVCFMLSPAASYISGATLRVDAGQSLYHSMWEIPGMCILPLVFSPSRVLSYNKYLRCFPSLHADHSAWPDAPEGENLDALKEMLNPQSKL